jgi:L-threonylcarbamoyladenylate synthase
MTPEDEIQHAAIALKRGELVILPTETVYGLAADAANGEAVARIFEAKGRPRFNPLIAHVADAAQAERIAVLDGRARALADAFWPGPLTIVAPVRDRAGVCDLARAVIAACGGAGVAPSANRSGRPSPTTFDDAVEETGDHAGAALDGGRCAVGVESTVVAVMDGALRLLRPGSVTRDEIEAVAGALSDGGGDGHRSPGRLALHYAPDAPVRLNAERAEAGEILLGFGPVGQGRWSLSEAGDLRETAANLFRMLREADREKPRAIAVAPIPAQGLGEAVNDRLKRAAGFVG